MSRATEEYGDHPLFALERGELTEAEFRDLIHPHLENGFDFARLGSSTSSTSIRTGR